ncbi:MAG: hypothetical protein OXI15_16965 [Chromatiales bacterium]|nr:hypothetical protein [Chromatiales bacterium]
MTFVQSQPIVMARPDMSRLSQETLAILGVGVALAALILTSIAGMRGEIQAVRDELRVEIQAVRTEARADREAMRADHETFQNHILRLTEQQGVLRARLDGISDPPAPIR